MDHVDTLKREVALWQVTHDATKGRINGHFTPADARIKLKKLYPSTEASHSLAAAISVFS
jgi:hypothetical protein